MAEKDSSENRIEKAAAGAFNIAVVLFLLIGSGSVMAQAIAFPNVEPTLGPLFVLWVITAISYFAGAIMIIWKEEAVFLLGLFFVLSSLNAAALVGTIAIYVLTAREGISLIEYLALGAYAFFLGVIVLVVLSELQKKRAR